MKDPRPPLAPPTVMGTGVEVKRLVSLHSISYPDAIGSRVRA